MLKHYKIFNWTDRQFKKGHTMLMLESQVQEANEQLRLQGSKDRWVEWSLADKEPVRSWDKVGVFGVLLTLIVVV